LYLPSEDETFITSHPYFLYKDEVIEVAQNIEVDPRSLSIRSAVESIGISRVIEEVGFKRVIEEVGLQRVMEEVRIEDLVKILTPEKKEELRKLLDME